MLLLHYLALERLILFNGPGGGAQELGVGVVVVVVATVAVQSRCSLKGKSAGPHREHQAPTGVTAQAPSAH